MLIEGFGENRIFKMKKVLMVVCAALMSAVFFVGSANAGPSIDQQYTGGGASLAISSKQRMAQRFLPIMTGLSKVDIELANVGSNQKVTVTIRHKTGLNWDEADVAKVSNQIAINGWNEFDFDDVTVTKDGWYGIFVTADAGPQWKYNNGPSTYDRGYAIYDSDDYVDADFNFKTWGTTPVEMVAEQDISEQQNSTPDEISTPAGQTTGTGAAPATTTSASIKVASGLTALYSNNAANLHWTASTSTDIDGYKIFRSEAEKTGFTEIGKTVKTTVEYIDNKDLVVGKTYYYFVRVYKGTAESASTSTVSLLIPEATATANTNTNSTLPISTSIIDDTDYRTLQINWILGGVVGILVVLLVAYEREQKRKGGFPRAKHFRLVK